MTVINSIRQRCVCGAECERIFPETFSYEAEKYIQEWVESHMCPLRPHGDVATPPDEGDKPASASGDHEL